MKHIKLQITLKPGTFLYDYFLPILKDRAEVGRQKIELGIRAGSFKQVIRQAVRESLADSSIVAAAPPTSGDIEDPAARVKVDNLLGDIFDEGDKL